MRERIKELKQEFEADNKVRMPMFLSLTLKERETLLQTEKILGISKNRLIGIACRFLMDKMEEADKKEAKKDGKEI